jgi:hypothetical protein
LNSKDPRDFLYRYPQPRQRANSGFSDAWLVVPRGHKQGLGRDVIGNQSERRNGCDSDLGFRRARGDHQRLDRAPIPERSERFSRLHLDLKLLCVAECVDQRLDCPRVAHASQTLSSAYAIDHLRGSPLAANLLSSLIEAEEPLLASEVVRFELLAGVCEREVDALEQFFSAISWVPVEEEVARAAPTVESTTPTT